MNSVTMALASELGVALAIIVQLRSAQSTISSIYYEKISVESASWTDITAHTLPG